MKISEFFTNVLHMDLNGDLPSSSVEPNTQTSDNGGAGQNTEVNATQQSVQQVTQQNTQQTVQQNNTSDQSNNTPSYAELMKQIEDLKTANNALLNKVEVEKPPTFDECIYNIYKESRGIFDGNDGVNNTK